MRTWDRGDTTPSVGEEKHRENRFLLSDGGNMYAGYCPYCDGFLKESSIDKDASWNKVLFETENFVVVPTLGAITEGWLLLITKSHFLSMGALSLPLLMELNYLKEKVSEVLSICYTKPTVFEHGPANPSTAIGCCVDHAHMHLVPVTFDLIESATRFSKRPIAWKSVGDIEELKNYYSSQKSYLYVELADDTKFIALPSEIPHQFFRQVIANEVSETERYDWALHPYDDKVRATIKKVEECETNLKLKERTELELFEGFCLE